MTERDECNIAFDSVVSHASIWIEPPIIKMLSENLKGIEQFILLDCQYALRKDLIEC